MSSYVLAIDQSTQGTKAMIFNNKGELVCRRDIKHRQIVLPQGWIEHDPDEIYGNTIKAVHDVIKHSGLERNQIVCAGISNQRETALVWEKTSGRPVYNAIVWQCARAKEQCEKAMCKADMIKSKTGLMLSPYFSAAKINWILDYIKPNTKENLACGTIDSWLLFKLTGNHKTDVSNAARTQLMNIDDLIWDKEICDLFDIEQSMLPEICDSDSLFGFTSFGGVFDEPIPIHSVLGDSNGALLAHGCFEKGDTKCTYGTGSSIMMNTGDERFENDLLSTSIAWKIDGKVDYVIEGNINYSGAIISWLCDDLKLIFSPSESAELAEKASKEDGTYLVPAFSGLGAPYWASDARACFYGMTRETGKNELVKASLRAIGYQVADVVKSITHSTGMEIKSIFTDGEPTKNKYLMQFQSDIADSEIVACDMSELSGAGAALLAGEAAGIINMRTLFKSFTGKHYTPKMDMQERKRLDAGWKKAMNVVVAQV